jgi:hypothetical protein
MRDKGMIAISDVEMASAHHTEHMEIEEPGHLLENLDKLKGEGTRNLRDSFSADPFHVPSYRAGIVSSRTV